MTEEVEKFLDEQAYKSAHSMAKLNPELLADMCAEYAIKSDRLEKEIKRLKKYEMMVQFISNDYYEFSFQKAFDQRDDWRNRCRKLIEEDNE